MKILGLILTTLLLIPPLPKPKKIITPLYSPKYASTLTITNRIPRINTNIIAWPFIYPSNMGDYYWELQYSTNLIIWIPIMEYGQGLSPSTNSDYWATNFINRSRQGFYRMHGYKY